MGKNSAIEWTHHTFNPWWGCVRVSPGCEHCYAETFANRLGHRIWGPPKTTPRREFGDAHWAEPLKWNRDAERAGERRRVFCASMADVFEDHPQLPPLRERLWALIEQTPALDWLLLTKRPENIDGMLSGRWSPAEQGMPRNVWLGFTAEDQRRFDERWAIMEWLKRMWYPVVVFLSAEPLLGPLNAADALHSDDIGDEHPLWTATLDWVICGGESGHSARPMHPQWARGLRDQCAEACVPFLFKQHGEYIHETQIWHDPLTADSPVICTDAWAALVLGKQDPADRGWQHEDRSISYRVGKRAAGRLLDGVEWSEFPDTIDTTAVS